MKSPRLSGAFFWNQIPSAEQAPVPRRLAPISATTAEPSSHADAGTGTTATLVLTASHSLLP
jgi:hypothetical protein